MDKSICNIEKEFCSGCRACEKICPQNAIFMKDDEEGFLYPSIDTYACNNCGLCRNRCPNIGSLNKILGDRSLPLVFGAWAKDRLILESSSSGGIFMILAEHIINQNGSVYGVVLNYDKKESEHKRGISVADIALFSGSKYMQSDVGDTYLEVKKDLLNNKIVLYTGTPCQVAGLYSFLGKNYENLITADLICHGVFSKNIYKKEIEYWENKYKGVIRNFRFRCKRKYGWSDGGVVSFDVYRKNKLYKHVDMLGQFSPMYYGFAYAKDYMILRQSCYNCKYRTTNRIADITIGDYWGFEQSHPEQVEKEKLNNGVSLVFLNSTKGKNLFDDIKEKTYFFQSTIEKAAVQPALIGKSRAIPIVRDIIYKSLLLVPYRTIIKRFLRPKNYFVIHLKHKIKCTLKSFYTNKKKLCF